ncbi:MAG: SDR family oxidoreductase [Desulforhopalus sp.]|nr:SDR family oxidoreductase [Desulforhopalus sp.]
MQLRGKIALIPGASRPIGRAIARKFAALGATLVLPVFDWPESIVEMEAEFNTHHYQFHTIAVDLRNNQEVEKLAETVKTRFKALDFLINNIERGGMPVVHGGYELPHNEGQWNLEIETTMKSKWLLYHHLRPLMQDRTGAAIVNISSIAGIIGRSGPAAAFFNDGYSAANRAIQTFTETWAREMAPAIRVNELMLGLIRSRHGEGTRGWDILSEQEKHDINSTILLKRTGFPDEVAAGVYYLAVEASYITGSILRMDGGLALGGNVVPPFPSGILA